jgi:hypothetical protein
MQAADRGEVLSDGSGAGSRLQARAWSSASLCSLSISSCRAAPAAASAASERIERRACIVLDCAESSSARLWAASRASFS